MPTEKDFQISPIVQDSVIHNTRTLQNVQSLTASLFGVAAGILGLESYSGFLFYAAFSVLTSLLVFAFRVAPFNTGRYFRGQYEFWAGGLSSGLAGFILTWTLFYGLVRA